MPVLLGRYRHLWLWFSDGCHFEVTNGEYTETVISRNAIPKHFTSGSLITALGGKEWPPSDNELLRFIMAQAVMEHDASQAVTQQYSQVLSCEGRLPKTMCLLLGTSCRASRASESCVYISFWIGTMLNDQWHYWLEIALISSVLDF
ncbi:UNVERIFIED_CONTAM: hypothetical protein K2H54_058541 [Gekko kuhli]